jgi:ankyrin repeat protein
MSLLRGVTNGQVAVVKLLLEAGAEREFKDDRDRTLLWWARISNHENIIKLFTPLT